VYVFNDTLPLGFYEVTTTEFNYLVFLYALARLLIEFIPLLMVCSDFKSFKSSIDDLQPVWVAVRY
jgi:hypothetical protein